MQSPPPSSAPKQSPMPPSHSLGAIEPLNAASVSSAPSSVLGKRPASLEVSELTCPVCLAEFEDPRALGCLHSFCLKCIKNFQKSRNNEIICPQCRQPTSARDCESLAKNFWIGKLKEARRDEGPVSALSARPTDVADLIALWRVTNGRLVFVSLAKKDFLEDYKLKCSHEPSSAITTVKSIGKEVESGNILFPSTLRFCRCKAVVKEAFNCIVCGTRICEYCAKPDTGIIIYNRTGVPLMAKHCKKQTYLCSECDKITAPSPALPTPAPLSSPSSASAPPPTPTPALPPPNIPLPATYRFLPCPPDVSEEAKIVYNFLTDPRRPLLSASFAFFTTFPPELLKKVFMELASKGVCLIMDAHRLSTVDITQLPADMCKQQGVRIVLNAF